MTNPRFSLIIPCYNVAKYLDECAASVTAQTFRDFEALLVNDGSTDDTLSICRKWTKRDARLRVIDKPNGGLSDARNRGMAESKGQYLVFLDGDDFIEPRSLQEINAVIASGTEIVVTRLMEDFVPEAVVKDPDMESFFREDQSLGHVVSWVMRKTQNTWPSVKYVVANDFAKRNRLTFLVGYIHEDMDWTTRLFSKAKDVAVCCAPWYHHRMARPGSITNTMSAKRIMDVIEIAHGLIDGPESAIGDYPESLRSLVVRRIMNSVFPSLVWYKRLGSRNDKDKVLACAEKRSRLFRFQPKRKFKLFMLFVKLFGFRKTLDAYSALPFDF